MRLLVKETLFAAGAVGLAGLFMQQSARLTASAALLPRILAAAIVLLAVIMVINAARDERKAEARGAAAAPEKINISRVCVFLGMIAAYVALVEPVGYFIVTPIFIVASYRYLKAMNAAWAVAVAVGFSALIYVVFVRLLHLPVPTGIMERMLEG